MKKKKNVLRYMLIVSIILYFIIILNNLRKTYRFIHVYTPLEFLIVFSLSLLPITVVSLLIIAYKKINTYDIITNEKKKIIRNIFVIIIYPLILLLYYGVMYYLLCGTLCSSTERLSNYLVVDKKINGAGSLLFPSNIDDCDDSYYKYFFSTFIDDEYKIHFECTFSQDTYENEKRRIGQIQDIKINNYYYKIQYIIGYGAVITFYENEKRVSYDIEWE